ncbi:FG-GAP-like repeat-containing protein [Streptomyces sp. NPDC051211]|uniref:FG-GAP-like repeat-containing protein n=1 Tax=Streptomyces sp. NPDC051211 TaxID=3154643 RepID=UPI00344B3B2F
MRTKHSTLRRTAVATAVVAAVATAIPLTSAAGAAVAAEDPAPAAEYVVPARKLTEPHAAPVAMTADGFLRKGPATGTYLWTAYGSDEARPVGPFPGTPQQAGEHTVAFVGSRDGRTAVAFRDMRNGSSYEISVPAGQSYVAVAGDAVLTTTQIPSGQVDLRWLTVENGQQVERSAGRAPGTYLDEAEAVTRHGVLLSTYTSGAGTHYTWVGRDGGMRDAAHLRSAWAAGDWLVTSERTDDTLVRWFKVWDTKGSVAPEAAKQFNEAYLHSGGNLGGVVGSDAVQLGADGKLYALPLDGGAPRVLVDKATSVKGAPGGTVVATGPLSGSDLAVYGVLRGEDGRAVVRRSVLPEVTQRVVRIAMDNGRVHTIDRYPLEQPTLSQYVMPPGGAPAEGTWTSRGAAFQKYFPGGCGTAYCPELLPTGDGGLVAEAASGNFGRMDAESTSPSDIGRLSKVRGSVQTSGQYVAWTSPDRTSVQTYNLSEWKLGTAPIPAADGVFALSGSWVWREKSTGVLEAVDVRTGSVVRTEAITAACDITSLQAWASSVYWKCDADSGVYDTATKLTTPMPAHNSARLGNGFVAWEKDGVLNSTALRGTPGARRIGTPVNVRPGEGWTVDKQSGRIGYVDASQAVHVVDAGVPAAALSSYDRIVETPRYNYWVPRWWLNQPAASWTLTLTRKAGGTVVRTFKGGEARGYIRLTWDGKDEAGKLVPIGEYVWTLTAKPAAEGAADLKATGSFGYAAGVEQRRDFAGLDGFGELVTLDAKGALTFHQGDGKGGFGGPKVTGAGWPTTSTVIPFGDVDGGRCNDVLVRNSAGTLRSYQPKCGTAVTPSTGSKWLGTGFNAYDVLTSAGDVTGDGRPDLLGRQATTGDLYLFAHDGKGGLKSGLKVSGGWKAYKQLLGAGDLNGDGQGDLLAVDDKNTLWRFDGAGNGTFKARVQVNGAGWAAGRVQLIGVGDISGDGKADIVSRNAAGELLRNNGDGKGGLQATVKIATGFGGYKGIS